MREFGRRKRQRFRGGSEEEGEEEGEGEAGEEEEGEGECDDGEKGQARERKVGQARTAQCAFGCLQYLRRPADSMPKSEKSESIQCTIH